MFLDSLDIANKVCQLVGATQIASPTEDSKNNREIAFAYDKERRAELRRNTWTFAVRKVALRPVDTTTMLLQPDLYTATKSYLPGAIVRDTNGLLWQSSVGSNVNSTPGGNNETWDMYFGPMAVSKYDSTLTYWAGELIYVINAAGTPPVFQVFQSLVNANTDVPTTATVWSAATLYDGASVVSHGGYQWRSLLEVNIANTPAVGPADFDVAVTYTTSNTVTASDGYIYSSVGTGNVGHDPTTDAGVHWTNTGVLNAWSKTPTLVVSSTNWRAIDATMVSLSFLYPVGAGPVSQQSTRNVYRLPAGFLKKAPQDPKAGSSSYLGAPSHHNYDNWNLEGNFLVSDDFNADPIILRFVADVTKVRDMDEMFCVGLACNIATAVCESLTQSTAKLQALAAMYKLKMGEARLINAIEAGAVEADEDDFITCRR